MALAPRLMCVLGAQNRRWRMRTYLCFGW